MSDWQIDRGRPVPPSPSLDTNYAYALYLETGDDKAELTVEWVDGAMGSEAGAHLKASRYLSDLGEGERPARRLIVDREGRVSVAEPAEPN